MFASAGMTMAGTWVHVHVGNTRACTYLLKLADEMVKQGRILQLRIAV